MLYGPITKIEQLEFTLFEEENWYVEYRETSTYTQKHQLRSYAQNDYPPLTVDEYEEKYEK